MDEPELTAKHTKARIKALTILSAHPLTPGDFAARMWPDTPVRHYRAMQGGSFLAKMAVDTGFIEYRGNGSRARITDLGRRVLAGYMESPDA